MKRVISPLTLAVFLAACGSSDDNKSTNTPDKNGPTTGAIGGNTPQNPDTPSQPQPDNDKTNINVENNYNWQSLYSGNGGVFIDADITEQKILAVFSCSGSISATGCNNAITIIDGLETNRVITQSIVDTTRDPDQANLNTIASIEALDEDEDDDDDDVEIPGLPDDEDEDDDDDHGGDGNVNPPSGQLGDKDAVKLTKGMLDANGDTAWLLAPYILDSKSKIQGILVGDTYNFLPGADITTAVNYDASRDNGYVQELIQSHDGQQTLGYQVYQNRVSLTRIDRNTAKIIDSVGTTLNYRDTLTAWEFSHNGQFLALSFQSGLIHVFDASNLLLISSYKLPSTATDITFFDQDKKIAASHGNNLAIFSNSDWNTPLNHPSKTLTFANPITGVESHSERAIMGVLHGAELTLIHNNDTDNQAGVATTATTYGNLKAAKTAFMVYSSIGYQIIHY